MNKFAIFDNFNLKSNLKKKGKGVPLLLDQNSKQQLGMGSSVNVLINDRRDDLLIGKGVVLNKPNSSGIRKKPLKLNI